MNHIPFTKLHGAENDFLLTWADDAPSGHHSEIARRICARHTGVGADGWMLISRVNGGLQTQLFNSDGSEAEISGNGTRCAAAFALRQGAVSPEKIIITTAAGPKTLRLVSGGENRYLIEMDMGLPQLEELSCRLRLAGRDFDATVLNVGNPQCALFVDFLPTNWLEVAREAESHPRFPRRTNVSFVRVIDRHALDVVFFERGAGETRSSGTGSTGAAAAAILRRIAESPVEIKTLAGSLHITWEDSIFLTGPAEIVGEGRVFVEL